MTVRVPMTNDPEDARDARIMRLALAAVALHGLLAGRKGDDFGEVVYPAAAVSMADAVIEAINKPVDGAVT